MKTKEEILRQEVQNDTKKKTVEPTIKNANEFINLCNCFGLVNAKEGGVLELDSLLIDFYKWFELRKNK